MAPRPGTSPVPPTPEHGAGTGRSLDERYTVTDGSIYLTGLQALVRTLLDRQRHDEHLGHRGSMFVSGYEGSPLAGYDLELQRRRAFLDAHRIVHRPGLNEELAATSVFGTQLAGRVATLSTAGITGVWYGKAPGLDRAADAVRHALLAGTAPTGGVVALVGDDATAKSSTVPSSSEPALAELQLPTFSPADPREVLEHGLHAVELSRAAGVWSAMKIATNVADGSSTVEVNPLWNPPSLEGLPGGLQAYTHVPDARFIGATLAGLERSLQERRLPIAQEYVRRSDVNRLHGARGSAQVGLVAAGKTYLDLRQALDSLGLDEATLAERGVRLLQFGAVVPVEPTIVRDFADGLHEIIVVEDKRSYLEAALKDILYGSANAPVVVGKRDPHGAVLFPATEELDPVGIAAAVARRLREHPGLADISPAATPRSRGPISLPIAARTPYFCSGCPHNSSTRTPEGALVGGGIGCHALVMVMDEQQVGTVTGVTQMGGEGAQWIGMEPFVENPHFIQNLGDGTFAHSGSLAVRAAVAAGVTITYKVLLNSTVAMTGGQDPVGGRGGLAQVVSTLLADGVARVVVTTEAVRATRRLLRRHGLVRRVGPGTGGTMQVRHRDDLVTVQEELAAHSGVTVIVHDQECAAELRRKRKRGDRATPRTRVVINESVCEGCGDCGQKSNCLSVRPVDTEFGRKTQIHQSSCNLDLSCLHGDCPSFVTVVPDPERRRSRPGIAQVGPLPDPGPVVPVDDFTLRIAGVGGTGIVTVAQILATAAALDGKHVRALDQTGVAQKGGAVISDVKISAAPRERAAKVAGGECDLYLVCDSLVGTDPKNLAVTDPSRTLALVSTAEVPTGHMVVDPTAAFPGQAGVRSAIDSRVRRTHYLAADRLSDELFGDEQFANILLVGAAYQAGGLPITEDSITQAIRLNGARVEANLAAFRHGRRLVAEPDEASTARDAPTTGDADALITHRTAELTAYQDTRYADEFARFVDEVRRRETTALPGSTAFTEAVARHLYKLMAYKDEYEVARLILDPTFGERLRAEWGPGAQVRYRLHPPFLRALGMRDKISLGPWARPAFRFLRGMRRLRGTAADPFGYAHVRRVERALIVEYRQAIRSLLPLLGPDTVSRAVTVAELPDSVRGYEDVKLGSVERYRSELTQRVRDLTDEVTDDQVEEPV